MVSNANDDLPDPDKPVITVGLSLGIFREIFLSCVLLHLYFNKLQIDNMKWKSIIEYIYVKRLNKVLIIGNLGADPEIKYTQAGSPVANLSIATSERWKDKTTGEQKEQVEWHRVVIFGRLLK